MIEERKLELKVKEKSARKPTVQSEFTSSKLNETKPVRNRDRVKKNERNDCEWEKCEIIIKWSDVSF